MLKQVYLFEDPSWGVAAALPRAVLGANMVAFQTEDSLLEALNAHPKNPPQDFVILICDVVQARARVGIALVQRLRFDLGVRQPIIVLSFDTEDRLAAYLAPVPLLSGTYFVRVPVMIGDLKRAIREAEPLSVQTLEWIATEFQQDQFLQRDQLFRHRCANVASALRILQGAWYTGDVTPADYRDAIQGLADLAAKDPTLAAYRGLIAKYLASLPEAETKKTPRSKKARLEGYTLLLLDDEAVTAGWHIVLTACLKPLGLQLEVETSRERFHDSLAADGTPAGDVLLLDLRMPDNPEASIEIIERMAEWHPTVPVIVFTALADVPNYRKCQRAGAFDYFVKELGQEDRDPQAYYKKFKELVLRALEYRVSSQAPGEKTETVPSLGRPVLDVRNMERTEAASAGEDAAPAREYWQACFGFCLEAPEPLDPINTQVCHAKVVDDQARLLSWLAREPADGRCLTLRYLCDPAQDRLEVVFIGKVEAVDRNTAVARARDFFRNVSFYLADAAPPYVFTAVRDAKTLLGILEGSPHERMVTIEREPLTVEVDGQVLAGAYPFVPNPTSTLTALLNVLLKLRGRTAFRVTLWPTDIQTQLQRGRSLARDIAARLDKLTTEDQARVSKAQAEMSVASAIRHGGFSPWVLEEQLRSLDLIKKQLAFLAVGALAYRSDLAAEDPIPSALLETFRFDMFGPIGEVRFRPLSQTEATDRHKRWDRLERGPSADLSGIGSIEDVLDLSQAAVLFRLPFPTSKGLLGMESESGPAGTMTRTLKAKLLSGRGFAMAETPYKGEAVPVRLKDEDLMQHLYVCGKSGTGKSTLLLRLALSIIEEGKGLCLIDPHGDLFDAVLERIPATHRDRVVTLDPEDPTCPSINLLENDGSEAAQELIIQEVTAMMIRLFSAAYTGPTFERILRNMLIPLMAAGKSLGALAHLWHEKDFRDECLSELPETGSRNIRVHIFWKEEFPSWNGEEYSMMETYVTSKFDRIINGPAAKILCHQKTPLHISKVMQDQGVLLAKLPVGSLGELGAYMVGTVLAFKVRQATQARATLSPAARKPFFFIIDEFHRFVGSGGLSYTQGEDVAFTSLLSEARKFKVGIVLANQYVHQLGQGVRNAVFGNVQSRICFAVSREDAEYLSAQFASSLKREDFQHLPKYHAYAQLLVNNETLPPFMVKTIPPAPTGAKR